MKILTNKTYKELIEANDQLQFDVCTADQLIERQEAKINTLIRENNELKRQINELKK
jgi:cell division protein FtsB